MSDPEGRRIYIARNSLRRSVANYGGAYAVSYALAATRGARIISHDLEDPISPAHHMMRSQVTAKIIGHVVAARDGTLDEQLLRNTGHVPNRPKRENALLPVLRQEESTFATCYDSDNNWYTFATGAAAAERMWQDDEPATSLLARLGIEAEKLPGDISDLTVITAEDDLFPVRSNPDGTYIRSEVLDLASGQGSRRKARAIDAQTRERYLGYLDSVGLSVYHELVAAGDTFIDGEARVLGDVFANCRNSLSSYASY
jgi:hypothetical protein